MKKIVLIIYLVAVILFGTFTFVNAIELLDCGVPNQSDTYIAPQGSKEELYQDIFMTMLNPYIQKAVDDYYGKHYAVDPVAEILSIDRPNGYRTFYFIIKLQVVPYKGAHNAVGIDQITLSVSPGDVKVEKFEHVKTIETIKSHKISYAIINLNSSCIH